MTPAEMLAATAADMRAVADGANTSPGAVLFWAQQHGKVAVQSHIAAWSPDVARAVAAIIDDLAADDHDAVGYEYGSPLCVCGSLIPGNNGCDRQRPVMALCAAWWKSRGRDPVEP